MASPWHQETLSPAPTALLPDQKGEALSEGSDAVCNSSAHAHCFANSPALLATKVRPYQPYAFGSRHDVPYNSCRACRNLRIFVSTAMFSSARADSSVPRHTCTPLFQRLSVVPYKAGRPVRQLTSLRTVCRSAAPRAATTAERRRSRCAHIANDLVRSAY